MKSKQSGNCQSFHVHLGGRQKLDDKKHVRQSTLNSLCINFLRSDCMKVLWHSGVIL